VISARVGAAILLTDLGTKKEKVVRNCHENKFHSYSSNVNIEATDDHFLFL
jgi:hypothetical protein